MAVPEVTDTVRYALPFGPIGRLAHALFVWRPPEAIFDHRERTLEALLGSPPSTPGPAEGLGGEHGA